MASELEDTRDFEGVEAGLQSLRVKQACRDNRRGENETPESCCRVAQ